MSRLRSVRVIAPCMLLFSIALLALAVACSDDNNNGSSGSNGGSAPEIPEANITARDFSFDSPNSVTAGIVKLSLSNQGQEPHHAQLARLNDGVTDQQFTAALQNPDPTAVFGLVSLRGGPSVITPGNSQVTYGDMAQGRHVMLCFVAGADEVPHFAKGMLKFFDVTERSGTAPEPPTARAQISGADFSFLGADTLPSGKSLVEFTNGGPQPHEMSVIKLGGDYTADQLKIDLAAEAAGTFSGPEPMIEDGGGVQALDRGLKGWAELDLTAGNYALVCFVPDAASGQPHAYLGMVKGITVR